MQSMLPSANQVRKFSLVPGFSQRSVHRPNYIVCASTAVPSKYKKVAPVGDRVFVKIDKEEDKTTSGILLPSSAQKKPTQGEIVDIGDAKALKAGDKVVYSKYAGTEISVEGNEHVLLKEEDVIGLLNSTDISELKPLADRILIQVEQAETQTSGGLVLTSTSREQPTLGRVIAVGSGKADDKGNVVKSPLSVGDTVLYSKYSGVEFEGKDDTQYIVVKDSDILASMS